MQLRAPHVDFFIPDGAALESALARTTHMAVAAHQDDIEMMAAGPVLECFTDPALWFTGLVVTDGRGSPRAGRYQDMTDEQMGAIRLREQRKAAVVGGYNAQIGLGYPSAAVKDSARTEVAADIAELLRAARPRLLFTHNLADKHDTHVGVALRVIAALRALPAGERPQKLFGCEVWRSLDWLVDEDKVNFDLSEHENLQAALLEVFDSQVAGGKRYDLASMCRRRANATFSESHSVDAASGLSFAMDMSPLLYDDTLNPLDFTQTFLERFRQDVRARMLRLL